MPFAPSRRVFHDADHLCPMDRRASSRSDASCRRDGVQPEGLIHHRGLRSFRHLRAPIIAENPLPGPSEACQACGAHACQACGAHVGGAGSTATVLSLALAVTIDARTQH
jgi:hypothetical protein